MALVITRLSERVLVFSKALYRMGVLDSITYHSHGLLQE